MLANDQVIPPRRRHFPGLLARSVAQLPGNLVGLDVRNRLVTAPGGFDLFGLDQGPVLLEFLPLPGQLLPCLGNGRQVRFRESNPAVSVFGRGGTLPLPPA